MYIHRQAIPMSSQSLWSSSILILSPTDSNRQSRALFRRDIEIEITHAHAHAHAIVALKEPLRWWNSDSDSNSPISSHPILFRTRHDVSFCGDDDVHVNAEIAVTRSGPTEKFASFTSYRQRARAGAGVHQEALPPDLSLEGSDYITLPM